MFVIEVLLGLFSGIVAAGIAHLFTRGKPDSGKLFGTITTVGTVLLIALLNQTVAPEIRKWNNERVLRKELQKHEIFREISNIDNAEYEVMVQGIVQHMESGASQSEAMASAQQIILTSFYGYVPTSTNEAVRNFMVKNISAIEELCEIDVEMCYGFSFNVASGRTGITKHLSKATSSELMAAMGSVITESKKNPQQKPDSITCQQNMEWIFGVAHAEFGDDIMLLADPNQDGLDKQRVVDALVFLYQRIFTLPVSEGGYLLRCLLSS